MTRLSRFPILSNRMAGVSVHACGISRSEYIPLKNIERCKGHGIHENHDGGAEQDAFQLRDWKDPTIEGQSRRMMSPVNNSQSESDG